MKNLSVYIHYPFCLKKCHYCNFTSFEDDKKVNEYKNALIDEIRAFNFAGYEINTIYFGGGTPSLAPIEFVQDIMKILQNYMSEEIVEISIEANPKTLTVEKLSTYKESGINRLSIGLQSANVDELQMLGRVHTFENFLQTYELAKLYFENINIDMIFGLPTKNQEQAIENLNNTLDQIIKLNPKHISAYSLSFEDGTKLTQDLESGKLNLLDEDIDRQMQQLVVEKLSKNKYNRYEISNYAKSGYESKHNLAYWKRKEYVGFGISAHSFYKNFRYENTSDLQYYLNNKNKIFEKSFIDNEIAQEEYVFLGLRLQEGIDLSKTNIDLDKIMNLQKQGYVNYLENNLSLTQQGFDVANEIIRILLV